MSPQTEQLILEKFRALPPEQRAQVEDFIDFLRNRPDRKAGRHVTRAVTRLSEPAFNAVWDNPDDADYDRL